MNLDLEQEIASDLSHGYSRAQLGGLLTFALMVDKIINLSDTAIENLTNGIKNHDIKTVPGKNISKVCRRFRYSLFRLSRKKVISSNLITALFKVFSNMSVPEYNQTFAQ
eukprot:9961304-Ditylum_brightwellii.AAC.1